MKTRHLIGAAAALALAGCASLPARVPLIADPEGQALLQGEWVGDYSSPSTGRAGNITFMLETHADSTICRGDVMMIPQGSNDALLPAESWMLGVQPESTAPSILQIELLKVTGDQLSGTIQAYRDPVTGHSISTTFEGTIRGNAITGELVSVDAKTGDRFTGPWQVIRKN
ncbi:MAG: hypothetical protein EXR93_09410 [Gemmatimonadetes bacterium]|nr:hypothetical protein [Gemmatimonadota bacterium]